MSSVTSGIQGYGTTISLADILAEEKQKSAAAFTGSYGAARATSADASQQSAGTSDEVVKAALRQAVKELAEKDGGKITFARIAEYRQELEKDFSAKMREGLLKAGLPKDTVFTLTLSKEGGITVNCDDENAGALIEEYLSENRKMCEEFGYIQALGSVERADRRAVAQGTVSLSRMKSQIQAAAVEQFFNSSLQSGFSSASLTAAFGTGDSAAFYSGISALV